MNEQEILEFKTSIKDRSIDDLLKMREELKDKVSQMLLDGDLIMKIVIVENQLKEIAQKELEEPKDGAINE